MPENGPSDNQRMPGRLWLCATDDRAGFDLLDVDDPAAAAALEPGVWTEYVRADVAVEALQAVALFERNGHPTAEAIIARDALATLAEGHINAR